MPHEDKNFRGSLVLDFEIWWRHVKTIYKWHVCGSYFLFKFCFTPENISWGNLCVESSSAAFFLFFDIVRMPQLIEV